MEKDLSEWMTNLPNEIKARPITKISIPGSHDSFATSSSLSLSLPVANDSGRGLRALGHLPGMRRFIRRWAVTQDLSVEEQLRVGIRYFDLRVSLPSMRKRGEDSSPHRVVHALYGDRLESILRDIGAFLEEHPKELVILDFNHTYGFDVDALERLQRVILSFFRPSQLLPPPSSIPISYTLQEIQDVLGANLILLMSDDVTDPLPPFWSSARIRAPWPDSDNVSSILSFLQRLSESWRRVPTPECLMVYQGVATARGLTIARHIFSRLEKAISRPMTEESIAWLESCGANDGINIVEADVVSSEFALSVIGVNYRK